MNRYPGEYSSGFHPSLASAWSPESDADSHFPDRRRQHLIEQPWRDHRPQNTGRHGIDARLFGLGFACRPVISDSFPARTPLLRRRQPRRRRGGRTGLLHDLSASTRDKPQSKIWFATAPGLGGRYPRGDGAAWWCRDVVVRSKRRRRILPRAPAGNCSRAVRSARDRGERQQDGRRPHQYRR